MRNKFDYSDPVDADDMSSVAESDRANYEPPNQEQPFNSSLLCTQYGLENESEKEVNSFNRLEIDSKLSVLYMNQLLIKKMLKINNQMNITERAENIINSENVKIYFTNFLNCSLLDPLNNEIDYDCIEQYKIFTQNLIRKKYLTEEELSYANNSLTKFYYLMASKIKTKLRRRIVGVNSKWTCVAPLDVYSQLIYSPISDKFLSAGKLIEARCAILRNIRFKMSSLFVKKSDDFLKDSENEVLPKGKQFWSLIKKEFGVYGKYKSLQGNKSLMKEFLSEVKPLVAAAKKNFVYTINSEYGKKRKYSHFSEETETEAQQSDTSVNETQSVEK